MKKVLIYRIVGVVIILIAVLLVIIGIFGGRAVKMGIETAGSKTLNVGVSVDDVDLSIFGGKIGMEGLVIDNPEGYKNEKFLQLRDGRVKVSIGSLLSDTVKIKEIKLDGIQLTLEQKGVTSNNLKDILNSLPKSEKEEDSKEGGGKNLVIDELDITDVTVKVKLLPIPGKEDTIPLKLMPIRMKDVGVGEDMDMAKLTGKILVAIAKGIAEAGTGILPEDMLGSITGQLEELGNLSKELLQEGLKGGEKILEEGAGILEEGADLGKEITEGIGGLFKKKDDK